MRDMAQHILAMLADDEVLPEDQIAHSIETSNNHHEHGVFIMLAEPSEQGVIALRIERGNDDCFRVDFHFERTAVIQHSDRVPEGHLTDEINENL